MMKTGAIAELSILEDVDLNAIAKEGSKMIGLYKAPGNQINSLTAVKYHFANFVKLKLVKFTSLILEY